MPMTLLQQYFYFLGVGLLYGAPLILLALFVSWRRRALLKGAALVLAAVLISAGLAQVAFFLDLKSESFEYDAESRALAGYAGVGETTSVVRGRYVGTEPHGQFDYGVYQFPALDGSSRWLEIVVPPGTINGAGFIRHAAARRPAAAPARLVVWPHAIGMNPSLDPKGFFARHVAGEDAHAFGEHTLVVAFRARRSNVIYPPAPGAARWVWRDAVNDL